MSRAYSPDLRERRRRAETAGRSAAEIERTSGTLDASLQASIDALWVPPRVVVVELSEFLTRGARNAVQQSMLRHAANQTNHPVLKGADACHLATAAYVGAKQFFTYDDKVLGQNGYFTFPIETPVALQGRLF